MALHPRQNSCSLFLLFGSFSISASCKFDQLKTNSARSKFGLSIVPLVSNSSLNLACFKFRLQFHDTQSPITCNIGPSPLGQ